MLINVKKLNVAAPWTCFWRDSSREF